MSQRLCIGALGVNALPYLELTGAEALRVTDGGLELYRVEALP